MDSKHSKVFLTNMRADWIAHLVNYVLVQFTVWMNDFSTNQLEIKLWTLFFGN